MTDLYKPSNLKEILNRHGFEFSKALGQNFLIDGNMVRAIVDGAEVGPEDLVIEIGPGAGTLTQALSRQAKKVIAIELDKDLLPILEESKGENVDIINADALEIDLTRLIEENPAYASYKLVANLPYNVGTKIVAKILEERVPLESLTIMLQKEVADRMVASPGTKEYGSISILVAYFTSSVQTVARVGKACFMPQPKIDSQVIRLNIKKRDKAPYEDLLFKIVRGAFTQRRKTITNSLALGSGLEKKEIRDALDELGIDPRLRAEDLSLDDFINIAKKFYEISESKN